MMALLRRVLLPHLASDSNGVTLRSIDLVVFTGTMMLAAVVVPLVHALVDHLLPGIPLHGGSLFVALLLTYALLTLTARLSLEVSGSMVTLTRKVLGVPWFIAKRPRAEVQVVMNPGFSSATLEARCAAWQEGAPLTLVDEQFHGLSALELEAWAAALADRSVVATGGPAGYSDGHGAP